MKITAIVSVKTKEQMELALGSLQEWKTAGIAEDCLLLLDADLVMEDMIADSEMMGQCHPLFSAEVTGQCHLARSAGVEFGLVLPHILRESDADYLQKLAAWISVEKPDWAYAGTVDGVGFLQEKAPGVQIGLEPSMYVWNGQAALAMASLGARISLPLELNRAELRELTSAIPAPYEMVLYGYAPFMVTANCVKKTRGCCDHDRRKAAALKDRKGNVLPVETTCLHCGNIIYNTLPTACWEYAWMLRQDGIQAFRVNLTVEKKADCARILQTYRSLLASDDWKRAGKTCCDKWKELGVQYTTGHMGRGVL